MNNSKEALTHIIKAMQADVENMMNYVDIAANDIGEGRQNSAIGALCGIDGNLERIASFLSAARAIHRMPPL